MNIEDFIECIIDTLSKLNICKDSSNGIVKYDIENAILYLKKMMIKNDYALATNDSNIILDNVSLYDTLLSVSDDIQYYNVMFCDDLLVGVWWNVCLAMSDLEVENSLVEEHAKKKIKCCQYKDS